MATTAARPLSHIVPDAAAIRPAADGNPLCPLPAGLQQAMALQTSPAESLQVLADAVARCVSLAALMYFEPGADGRLSDQPRWLVGSQDWAEDLSLPPLRDLCRQACEQGRPRIGTPLDGFLFTTVAVPVTMRDGLFRVLCAVLQPEMVPSPERAVEILQFGAVHVSLCCEQQSALRVEQEARISAALLEILHKIGNSGSLSEASRTLVNELQSFLGCQRVALGLCSRHSRHCHLQSVSGLARFDKHAEFTAAIEDALDETVLRGEIVVWPPSPTQTRQMARAHEQLLAAVNARSVVSAPLFGDSAEPIGAWLLLDPQDASADALLRAAQHPVGACLDLLRSGRDRTLARIGKKLLGRSPRRRRVCLLVSLLALVLLLAWPRPHRIVCECQLQPVSRRFVAAPFDGTLEKSYVEPGDIVAPGQVLAQMDGLEIRLELSALEAEVGRAREKWEASLALDDIYEAQQAKLEMQRLELKSEILRERQRNLQIKSPQAGIVVSGELKRSEGAPLTVGQNLFEIAPLTRMQVEVAVPESDIAYVRSGMELQIRLDAYPGSPHTARLGNIVPRAELRDEQFVFVAETELDNATQTLRPGMNGHATLFAPPRRLGWLWFHKPCESLLMLMGW